MSLGRAIAFGVGAWALSGAGGKTGGKRKLSPPPQEGLVGFTWGEEHDWIPTALTWSMPGRVRAPAVQYTFTQDELRDAGIWACLDGSVPVRIEHYDAGGTFIRSEYKCIPPKAVPGNT